MSRAVSIVRRMAVAAGACVTAVALVGAGPASAHDDIAGSVPADRSVIDEPISSVEIDFGEEISDAVQLFLLYDPGNGETDNIGGETTKTGPTTARLDFPEIEREGTYFVRYLGPVPSDGHVIAGAISFSYGEPTVVDHGDDKVRRSDPVSRSTIGEPISSATIDFHHVIADEVTLTLVYDRGDGENFDELAGETTKTGASSARLDFDEVDQRGTYFIRYDTTIAATGAELVGAISFNYGEPSGSGDDTSIVPIVVVVVLVLGIGAWFSYRRMRVVDDVEHDEDELVDATV